MNISCNEEFIQTKNNEENIKKSLPYICASDVKVSIKYVSFLKKLINNANKQICFNTLDISLLQL